MGSRRWLFPFTHGVDMRAIDTVVRLAGDEGATLVAVSLVSVAPGQWSQGARLEHIQQSKDFLEAVKYKAARLQVAIERYEDFTSNVLGSITLLTRDQRSRTLLHRLCFFVFPRGRNGNGTCTSRSNIQMKKRKSKIYPFEGGDQYAWSSNLTGGR